MIEEHTISTELLPPRLPALGMIKLGRLKPKVTSQKGNDFQPPEKLDFFLVTTRNRGADGNFTIDQAVHDVVGPKPTHLDVRLPFDSRPENFYAQMVHYKGRTRELECNGETCTKVATHVKAPCERRAGRECACKPYGRLAVILEAAPTFGGLYVFRTTSWESVNSLQTGLRLFQEQFGSLRGLPLTLRMYPAEVRFQQGGQERTSTAYKVALVLRAGYDEARAAAIEFHRQNELGRREILALAAGTVDDLNALDRTDAADIGPEFFPTVAAGETPTQSPSKVGDLNEELIDERISELRGLMARAEAAGVKLTSTQAGTLERAVLSRDTAKLDQSIDWLNKKLPAPAAEQPSLLES
jgi:hypothetical protein